jgi:hypothetical protein
VRATQTNLKETSKTNSEYSIAWRAQCRHSSSRVVKSHTTASRRPTKAVQALTHNGGRGKKERASLRHSHNRSSRPPKKVEFTLKPLEAPTLDPCCGKLHFYKDRSFLRSKRLVLGASREREKEMAAAPRGASAFSARERRTRTHTYSTYFEYSIGAVIVLWEPYGHQSVEKKPRLRV